VLSRIFDAEPDGKALYLHSSLGPSDTIGLSIGDFRIVFESSTGINSTMNSYVAERTAATPADDTEIEIDLSDTSWEFIFQGIVRRSSTLHYVTAVTSFTCSKMRPDGLGGMAVLITADAIVGKSTNDILEDFLAENNGGAGHGGRVLLRFREDALREQIGQAIETDPTLTLLTADAVGDDDIRTACLDVVESIDLSEERGAAEFRAAGGRQSAHPSHGGLPRARLKQSLSHSNMKSRTLSARRSFLGMSERYLREFIRDRRLAPDPFPVVGHERQRTAGKGLSRLGRERERERAPSRFDPLPLSRGLIHGHILSLRPPPRPRLPPCLIRPSRRRPSSPLLRLSTITSPSAGPSTLRRFAPP
jgi:hypothetical protein